MPRLLAALALPGCTGEEEPLAPSPAERVRGDEVTGYEAVGGAGPTPYAGTLRAINAFGASVPSEARTATVDGAAREVEVGFDALGYGSVNIGPGIHALGIDGATATVEVWPADWAGFGGSRGWPAPLAPVDAFPAGDGVVGRLGNELWWVGRAHGAHRVLAADADLLGARPASVDLDGVMDVVAWTSTTVFVLRGRGGGGLGWGTAYRAPGLAVAGADVGDVSGDNLPDLAIAWVGTGGDGILDVWLGDGIFGFEAAEPREFGAQPTSVVVSDASADGLDQVTVLDADGGWSRFFQAAEKQFVPVGPLLPSTVEGAVGGSLESCGDTNGDNGAELVVAAPLAAGQTRAVTFVDTETDSVLCAQGATGNLQCRTTAFTLTEGTGTDVACADSNADRVEEIWAYDEAGDLRMYVYDSFTRTYLSRVVGNLPDHGPFHVGDLDGDEIGDPAVAGAEAWYQLLGAPGRTAEDFWQPKPEIALRVRADVTGVFAVLPTEGETRRFLSVASTGGEAYLRLLHHLPLEEGSLVPAQGILPGSEATDLAVCGDVAYVAVSGKAVRVDWTSAPMRVSTAVGDGVTRLACGLGASGVAVATVEAGGELVLRDANLGELDRPADITDPAGDVAFVTPAAGGAQSVEICAAPADGSAGCSVVGWRGRVVVSDANGTRVRDPDTGEAPIGPRGELSVQDLEGDGVEELVAWYGAGRRMAIWHELAADAGPIVSTPELRYTGGAWGDRIGFVDGDGDGVLDLVGVDDAFVLVHSALVAPPEATTPTTPTTPGTTGDTGDTGAGDTGIATP